MRDLGSHEVAATLECTSVLFDLQTRKSIKISEPLRELASKHLIEKTDSDSE
jgi:acyl-CoA thioesterase FadM